MDLRLLEQELTSQNPDLNNILNKTLKEIFNPTYYNKIKNIVRRKISIVPVKGKGRNFYAFYTGGNKISVNRDLFFSEKLTDEQRVSILSHEFIHLLQRNKKFFLIKNFKQIHNLGKKLRVIVRQYAPNPTLFLTGKKHITLGAGNLLYEIVPYLIMGTVNWNHIDDSGEKLVLKILRESRVFNLQSDFWKKRLPSSEN